MQVSSRIARQTAPLPVEITPLLGRARESADLLNMVADPAQRLITIIGPGGVGKTRLVIHIAQAVQEAFAGAVVFVPLAAIRDPDLVIPEITQAFGVFSDPHDAPEDQLTELLQSNRTLLVLDNLEQVAAVAPALMRVLARCPNVTILATSQTSLDIAGEQLYPLAPLPTPEPDRDTEAIMATEAVALFVQRARAVKPDLVVDERSASTVAEIVRQLDGLPLAIELAAARTSVLSPPALLARLSNRLKLLGSDRQDVPDRLRTMRNAVAWSYDLLTPEEQALFRRLAVFAGGFSLEAAEAIAETVETDREIFEVLSALVRHSLMQPAPSVTDDDPRFYLLQTLRDFGLEQLDQVGEANEAYLAHARWVAELAQKASEGLESAEQDAWVARLNIETENIRTACEWTLANGQEHLALQIGAPLRRYGSRHGLGSDVRRWITRAIEVPSAQESPYYAMALLALGNLHEEIRQQETARSYFERARAAACESGNAMLESQALIGLGTLAQNVGDYTTAHEFHTGAVRTARQSGHEHTIARAVGNLGTVSYFRGNLDEAERYWEECRQLMADLGDNLMEAVVTTNLGALTFDRGDVERAEQLQQRALQLQRKLNATSDMGYTLVNLGEVLSVLGDYTQAQDCFAEAIEILRELGYTSILGQARHGLAALMKAQGDLPRAAAELIESTRLLHETEDARSLIGNAELLAEVCADHGHHTGVVTLVEASAVCREEIGAEATASLIESFDSLRSISKKALDDRTFAQARDLGRATTLDALPRRISIIAREIIGTQHPLADPLEQVLQSTPSDTAEIPPGTDYHLTTRETEVLRLLAQGLSTRDISDQLYISPRTVATHITNILGKLQVSSRTAAVAIALRDNLV